MIRSTFSAPLVAAAMVFAGTHAGAQTPTKMKMTTDIPPEITTPGSIATRLGTLKLFDGFPDEATTQMVYDNLDFQRGVQTFLIGMPGVSLVAMRAGFKKLGAVNGNILVFEDRLDSKALFLTGNTDSVYFSTWLDLKNGPLVIESPPKVLAFLDDFWFKYVADIGNAGPDKGNGGKYLVLPPGYKGEVPEGYFVARSHTYNLWLMGRGFLVDGSSKPAAESIKKNLRIYPLAQAKDPPATRFISASGVEMNTVHANDFSYFEELNQIVQEEPSESLDPESLGLFASIGIAKGKPFAPDARMKKILTEAAAVGNVTARAISMRPRAKETYFYPGSAWFNTMPGGNHEFLSQPGVRDADMRVLFHYFYTGITPAMVAKMVGIGSQYVSATTDSQGNGLDGGKTYKMHLPPNVPAKDFWSFTLYDNQTRSMLQTDQRFPSVNSTKKGIVTNTDGSIDVWFGPTLPQGVNAANWAQTIPGKGWNALFRLYGPLQPWFDKTWRVGEFELVK
jgi:hypothetical protein